MIPPFPYQDSPRNITKQYNDAMPIFSVYGKQDFLSPSPLIYSWQI